MKPVDAVSCAGVLQLGDAHLRQLHREQACYQLGLAALNHLNERALHTRLRALLFVTSKPMTLVASQVHNTFTPPIYENLFLKLNLYP